MKLIIHWPMCNSQQCAILSFSGRPGLVIVIRYCEAEEELCRHKSIYRVLSSFIVVVSCLVLCSVQTARVHVYSEEGP